MKIVIPGGTGQIGRAVVRDFVARGHEVVVLSRRGAAPCRARGVVWDGVTLGPWAREIDGAHVVLNLAGRTVDCRPSARNRQQMMNSRVFSTQAVGRAIAAAASPPQVWLQMSTATIYAHRYDAANDEATGVIGGAEPDAPAWWASSVWVAQAWECALAEVHTPHTRKVALRTAMVMTPDKGGVFDMLSRITRLRLGGALAGGRQFVSWIHENDFNAALRFLIRSDLSGPINLASPNPVPQRTFQAAMRAAWGVRVGLPAAGWMVALGAWLMRSDSELVRKSRRVVPGRLLEGGFEFAQPEWADAAAELVGRMRAPLAPTQVATSS